MSIGQEVSSFQSVEFSEVEFSYSVQLGVSAMSAMQWSWVCGEFIQFSTGQHRQLKPETMRESEDQNKFPQFVLGQEHQFNEKLREARLNLSA